MKILCNGKVYSDTSYIGSTPSEPITNGIRKTSMTNFIEVGAGRSIILNFDVNIPEDETILSVTPVCNNTKVLTSVQNITNSKINVNVANLDTVTNTVNVELIIESLVKNSLQYFVPETTHEEIVLDNIIETATLTKWGGVVSIKLGRFIDNYTATGGTLTIGTLPEKYRPITAQNGMISLRLGSNNVQVFFGVTSDGSVRINIPAGVSLNHEATYGYFIYVAK